MAKSSSDYPRIIKPSLLHKFLLGQEKSRFELFLEVARPNRAIFWHGVVSGAAKSFGFVIGAGVVASLVLALLNLLGQVIPGAAGDFLVGLNRMASEKVGL